MMSRKDYRAFAEILATSATVAQVRERMAHYLRCDNPRFNRDRFMDAARTRNTLQDPRDP